MKVIKRKSTNERLVLTGMIVNQSVLTRIASKWDKDGLFSSPWSNIVGKWCVDYAKRYNKAPGKQIEGIFQTWAENHGNEEEVQLVEKYLGQLSGEYAKLKKECNPDYVIDLAGELFNKVRLAKLRDALDGDLSTNRVEDAYKRINQFGKIEIGVGQGIDLFTDEVEFKDTFNHPREPVIIYPGAVGEFFGMTFERDSFVSFIAPGKRGKTFWLMDVAFRAMLQRKRVAFFQVGDLSKNQMKNRFITRVAGRPLYPTKPDKPVRYPKAISVSGEKAEVEFEDRHYKTALDQEEAWKAAQKVMKEKVKSSQSYFKLSCHPTKTLTISGLKSTIDAWDKANWLPDVVVIDYADILASPPGYMDSREAVNHNWMGMRALSQQLHGCVVTATQGNAASYKVNQLDTSNFSEDNRKLAHVTAMIGINQSIEEKRDQVQRLNYLVLREDDFVVTDEVFCAGCLSVANPVIRSSR
jgi:hypothetical protein